MVMSWLATTWLGCATPDEGARPTASDAPSETADTGAALDTGRGDTGTTTPSTIPEPRRLVAMLHGGGAEADDVFGRFVAEVGGGTIVTLGSVPANDPYLAWWDEYFVGLGASSARTINTLDASQADDPARIGDLAEADGIFIRGGDQARYLAYWRDTALHEALQEAIDAGAVVGGSSAGCALLGERAYDARLASVGPYDVLDDAQHPGATYTDGFLDLLPGVLTDTHFTERGRLGRLLVFQQHWRADGVDGLAVGVDPRTALFVYSDGTAEVMGSGSVTLLDGRGSTSSLPQGAPPDIRDVVGWQLPEGYVVDLDALDAPVIERPAYVQSVPPVVDPAGWSPLRLDGDNLAHRSLGSWSIAGLDDSPWAWSEGRLSLEDGTDELPGAVVLTRLWSDSDYFENHQGGMTWALSQQPHAVVVGVDISHRVDTLSPAGLEPAGASYALVLDGRTMDQAGWVDDDGWQRGALERFTVHVVGPGTQWTP